MKKLELWPIFVTAAKAVAFLIIPNVASAWQHEVIHYWDSGRQKQLSAVLVTNTNNAPITCNVYTRWQFMMPLSNQYQYREHSINIFIMPGNQERSAGFEGVMVDYRVSCEYY